MNLGLKHIAVPVKNMERAIQFYENHLGCISYYDSKENENWGMVTKNGTTLSFLLFDDTKMEEKSLGGHARHLGFCLESKKEVDEYYEKLKPIGAHTLKLHRDGSYGFYLEDTEKNFIEVIFIPLFPALKRFKEKKIYTYKLPNSLKLRIQENFPLASILELRSLEELQVGDILISLDEIKKEGIRLLKGSRNLIEEEQYLVTKFSNQFFELIKEGKI